MNHIMNANNKLCDFKQWCQLVLPLVYDDTLSYYEVLDKVVIYLNKTTKSVKSIYPILDEIIKELSDMQETLDNLDSVVDELVSEYLNSPEFLSRLRTLTMQFIDEALVPIREELADKADISDIPTKTSELTNDSNFISDANYVHTDNNFSNSDKSKLQGIETGAEVNVQSDWNVSDSNSDAFIKNKPTIPSKTSDLTNDSGFITEGDIPTKTSDLINDSNFISDADYVHTDNNFTNSDKTKLQGIETGAEVNVQSDWNVSDSNSDAFIKNKPTIPSKTSDLTNDSGFINNSSLTNYLNRGGYGTISSSANLNDYKTTGTYWLNGTTPTGSPTPTVALWGILDVYSYDNGIKLQRLTQIGSTGISLVAKWVRLYINSAWQAWQKDNPYYEEQSGVSNCLSSNNTNVQHIKCIRIGKMVTITFHFSNSSAQTGSITWATLKTQFRPTTQIYSSVSIVGNSTAYTNESCHRLYIYTDGTMKLQIDATGANVSQVMGSISYCIN